MQGCPDWFAQGSVVQRREQKQQTAAISREIAATKAKVKQVERSVADVKQTVGDLKGTVDEHGKRLE
eukprot:8472797-Karenia_brevis.AAC.1